VALYLCIIITAMVIIISFNILFNLARYGFTAWYVVLGVVLGVIFSIILDSIVAFVVRQIPEKKFNPFAKFFAGRKGEKKFYEKLNIRNWKDKIPELGKTLKYFDKTKVPEKPNAEYMLKFLKETCYAEVMHIAICPVAFILVFIFPLKYFWCISFPIVLVNIFLQLLPICVQRYTRPKLVIAYQRLLKQEQLLQAKQEAVKEKSEELIEETNKKETNKEDNKKESNKAEIKENTKTELKEEDKIKKDEIKSNDNKKAQKDELKEDIKENTVEDKTEIKIKNKKQNKEQNQKGDN